MRIAVVMAGAAALFAGSALAQTSFQQVDTDGSGELSYAETAAVIPDLTENEYGAADADGSGGLSLEEVNTLIQERQGG